MKTILTLIVAVIFSFSTVKAQTELWGMMSEGGKYGVGAIFKTDGNGDNFEVQHSFFKTVGATNQSALTETTNGKLFGLSSEGTVCDAPQKTQSGILYQYDITTDKYEIKHAFSDEENGSYPVGKLVYATNGKLYGITERGGLPDSNSGKGVIFEFDLATNTYKKIHDFDGTNGRMPSSLIQAKDGKLYGTTSYGGTDDNGLIFSYDIINSTYNVIYKFTGGNDGYHPHGNFVETSDGILYGVTTDGGANSGGTIYEFNIANATKTVKANLSIYSTDLGGAPSGLTLASNGKLYAASHYYNNQEYIIEYDLDTEISTKKKTIYSSYGTLAIRSLLATDDGKLYGTTSNTGTHNDGVIFEYNISTGLLSTLYNFDEESIHSGYQPVASLIQASNGKIYSTTYSGGRSDSYSDGVLYEFDLSTNTYSAKFSFEYSPLGASPRGGLIQAENNNLYGLTYSGGITSSEFSDGMGTLFRYKPSSGEYSVLVKLDESKGVHPMGNLLQANNGKLYGLTYQGGTTNWGTMFEYDIVAAEYKVLYNFDINGDREHGANPYGTLMQADNGKIYGFTSRGGVLADGTRVDNGTIFEFDTENATLTTIYAFDDENGKAPHSKLIQARNGLLYGLTASGGGYGKWGTLFSLDISSSTLTKLYSFSQSGNYNPLGGLTEVIIDEKSYLYGVTSAEGDGIENDAIFKYDIQEDELTFVKEFDGNDNYNPLNATLLLASDGNLYGIGPIKDTEYKYLFQYNIDDNSLESKKDFTCKKYTSTPLYVGELIEISDNYLSIEKKGDLLDKIAFAYPNPTSGLISIKSNVETSNIEIYNQLGQLVISNYNKQNIDISNLNSGIFFMKISDKKGNVMTQKIIKK